MIVSKSIIDMITPPKVTPGTLDQINAFLHFKKKELYLYRTDANVSILRDKADGMEYAISPKEFDALADKVGEWVAEQHKSVMEKALS